MFKRAFGALWRAVKAIFTLKGFFTIVLVATLAAAAVLVLPKNTKEPRHVDMQTETGAAVEESATPRIAIVITGLGGQGRGLDTLIGRLIGLGIPITYGVLPGTEASRRQARLVNSAPSEVAMQLPISFSRGAKTRRVGRVSPDMHRRQVARQVVTDIYSLGSAAGIVAPGGYGRGRTDAQMMRIVMTMGKRRNLFFLDSESNSAASRLADEVGAEYLKPDVMLDQEPTADGVKRQISVAINKALASKGNVIVLGHLIPVTVNTLLDEVPKIQKAQIQLTSVSGLNASVEPTTGPSLTMTPTVEPSITAPSTSTIPPPAPAPAPRSQFNF